MCTVSMIYDNFRQIPDVQWTTYPGLSTSPFQPLGFKAPRTPLEIFENLVEVAKELDTALGLADCEDPKKGEWLEKIREIVKQHEIEKIEERLKK